MQVVTVKVLEVESKTPDPRIAAWKGQELVVVVCAYGNCTSDRNDTVGELFNAAALKLVTHMDYCALADDNIVGMKVGGGTSRWLPKGHPCGGHMYMDSSEALCPRGWGREPNRHSLLNFL